MNNESHNELVALLGPAGQSLIASAQIAAWSPDANYKPMAYYLIRALDEAQFQSMASSAGMVPKPAPRVADATWQLAPGVSLSDWTVRPMPPEGALQFQGPMGQAMVWVRWQGGQAFMVVKPAMP